MLPNTPVRSEKDVHELQSVGESETKQLEG